MSLGWRRQRERGHRLLLATIIGIALGLGRSAARAVLYPIVWYFVVFSGPSRRAARRYLARVLGRRPARPISFGTFTPSPRSSSIGSTY
jgi:predicted LPLAT superfamily acyltransferase